MMRETKSPDNRRKKVISRMRMLLLRNRCYANLYVVHFMSCKTVPYTTYLAKSKATSIAVLMSRVHMFSKVSCRRRRNLSASLFNGCGTSTASLTSPMSVPPCVRTLGTIGFCSL